MVVQVPVRHRRAVDDHCLVEQAGVALHRLIQLPEEVRELPRLEGVDAGEVKNRLLVASVMRGRVEGLVDAALGIDPRRRVPSRLEREYARDVRREGQNLDVEHELHVLGEGVRDSGRRFRQLARLPAGVAVLDALDSPLQLADVLQVPVEPLLVVLGQRSPEIRDFAGDPVENAPVRAPARGALLGRASGAEEHLERHPRVADHGERLGRRGPADGVGIDARVAVRAASRLVHVLDAELHRRDRRILSEALRVHLVHGGAGEHVRAPCLPGMGLGEEDGARAEVVAADLVGHSRLGHPHVGVADDGETVAVGLEWKQRTGGEVEVAARRLGGPQVLGGAPLVAARGSVHHLDGHQPGGGLGRRAP